MGQDYFSSRYFVLKNKITYQTQIIFSRRFSTISDVRHELVNSLDWYLTDSSYDDIYEEGCRERIIGLRNQAEYLRVLLDTPPGIRVPVDLLDRIAEQRTRRVEDRRYVLKTPYAFDFRCERVRWRG
jgi:hypothetical protein